MAAAPSAVQDRDAVERSAAMTSEKLVCGIGWGERNPERAEPEVDLKIGELLHELKTREKLHGVQDRTLFLENCEISAAHYQNESAQIAIQAIDVLLDGNEGLHRYYVRAAMLYRLLGEQCAGVARQVRASAYEGDAARAMDRIHDASLVRESVDAAVRRHAQRMLECVGIARFLAPVGAEVAAEQVEEVLDLNDDVREKLRWLFFPTPEESANRVCASTRCGCDREVAIQASLDRLQEVVRCAECRTEWVGRTYDFSILRPRLGLKVHPFVGERFADPIKITADVKNDDPDRIARVFKKSIDALMPKSDLPSLRVVQPGQITPEWETDAAFRSRCYRAIEAQYPNPTQEAIMLIDRIAQATGNVLDVRAESLGLKRTLLPPEP